MKKVLARLWIIYVCWKNPVITDIVIPSDAKVTVGVKVEAAAGAWGAWDDFYLYEME